jgi:hypothetical protein
LLCEGLLELDGIFVNMFAILEVIAEDISTNSISSIKNNIKGKYLNFLI